MKMTRAAAFLGTICIVMSVSACGPSLQERSRIDFDNQIKSVKTIGMLDPDMMIYELSAGGVRELMDEWVEAATQNFSTVLKKDLQGKGLKVKTIALEESSDDEEISHLFRAITESLKWNKTYRKLSVCENKRICKDFSLGPMDHIFNKHKIDALLLVLGVNEMETAARAKARQRSRAVSRFLRVVAPVSISPLGGPGTYVSMALVDRNGSVLWYTGASSNRVYDLRNEAKVSEVTKRMLGHMWVAEQK